MSRFIPLLRSYLRSEENLYTELDIRGEDIERVQIAYPSLDYLIDLPVESIRVGMNRMQRCHLSYGTSEPCATLILHVAGKRVMLGLTPTGLSLGNLEFYLEESKMRVHPFLDLIQEATALSPVETVLPF